MERLAFPLPIPFCEALGLELWGFGGGSAELRVDLQPEHLNAWQVAHGGLLMTLLDVAMAHAARSSEPRDQPPAPGVATIEMKTTFMRPARGRLRAVGKLLHQSVTLAFTEATVYDEQDHVCAHATGTFKILRRLPGSARPADVPQRQAR